jgi:hypothetical protein
MTNLFEPPDGTGVGAVTGWGADGGVF